MISDIEINRMAQRFYEATSLSPDIIYPLMTGKSAIVDGLKAALQLLLDPTDEEIEQAARDKYPPTGLLEDYEGDRFVDDEYGYDEAQRAAFIAGAQWARDHG